MKYSAHKVFVSFGQLIALSILTCAVPAFAQFEVSPDHFDSGPAVAKTKTHAAKTSPKKTGGGSLSSKAAGKGSNQQAPQAVAGSNSQASSAAAGPSKSNGKSPAATTTTSAAVARPKKRAPANKVVLASTQ